MLTPLRASRRAAALGVLLATLGAPALAQTPYLQQIGATLAPATRAALVQATSPREWNLLFLSSPEFMHG